MIPRVRLLRLIPVAALVASCARAPVQLPGGNAALDATNDESGLLSEMIRACPRIPVAARLRVEGVIHGTRVRRLVWAGTDSVHMRIEASAEDGVPFVVWGSRLPDSRQSGLWLPREHKVVETGDLRELSAAAIGVPLNGLELHGLLTTCPMFDGGGMETYPLAPNARQIWLTQNESNTNEVNLVRRNARSPWRLRSVTVTRQNWPRWRVEFSNNIGAITRRVRLRRLEWTGEPSRDLDLRITIDRAHVDMGIGPGVLTPSLPAADARVTLSEITSSRGGRPLLVE